MVDIRRVVDLVAKKTIEDAVHCQHAYWLRDEFPGIGARKTHHQHGTVVEFSAIRDALFFLRPGGSRLPPDGAPRVIGRDDDRGLLLVRGRMQDRHQRAERVVGKHQVVQVVSATRDLMRGSVVDAGRMGDRHMEKGEANSLVPQQVLGMPHHILVVATMG